MSNPNSTSYSRDARSRMLEYANCSVEHANTLFPKPGESSAEGRKLCLGCIVCDECLELEDGNEGGIRGGLSEEERRRRKNSKNYNADALELLMSRLSQDCAIGSLEYYRLISKYFGWTRVGKLTIEQRVSIYRHFDKNTSIEELSKGYNVSRDLIRKVVGDIVGSSPVMIALILGVDINQTYVDKKMYT